MVYMIGNTIVYIIGAIMVYMIGATLVYMIGTTMVYLIGATVVYLLLVCFVALCPKSTATVMGRRSVHLTTLFFFGKLEQAVNQYFVHIL